MSLEITYYSVKIENISSLMEWGREMQTGILENCVVMKKEMQCLKMMFIFDKIIVEKGNDEDELLVMTVGELVKYTPSQKNRRRLYGQHENKALHDMLRPLSGEYKHFPGQDATLVYISAQ